MPLKISCPGCRSSFKVADHNAGKHAKCPKCGTRFPIAAPSTPDLAHATPGKEHPRATPTALGSSPEHNPASVPPIIPGEHQEGAMLPAKGPGRHVRRSQQREQGVAPTGWDGAAQI
jgi:predicted Zn finger-like uncharacterized protein